MKTLFWIWFWGIPTIGMLLSVISVLLYKACNDSYLSESEKESLKLIRILLFPFSSLVAPEIFDWDQEWYGLTDFFLKRGECDDMWSYHIASSLFWPLRLLLSASLVIAIAVVGLLYSD